jgi:hypothetical protein
VNAVIRDSAAQEELMRQQNDEDESYVGIVPTYSGLRVNIMNVDPDTIRPMDFAYSLMDKYRYNGHTIRKISVLEHTLKIVYYFETVVIFAGLSTYPDLIRYAMLHDTPEAYMGDMIRPIKISPIGALYIRIEDYFLDCILKKFNVPNLYNSFKIFDTSFTATELLFADMMVNGEERSRHYTPEQISTGRLMYEVLSKDEGIYSKWGWKPSECLEMFTQKWGQYFPDYRF